MDYGIVPMAGIVEGGAILVLIALSSLSFYHWIGRLGYPLIALCILSLWASFGVVIPINVISLCVSFCAWLVAFEDRLFCIAPVGLVTGQDKALELSSVMSMMMQCYGVDACIAAFIYEQDGKDGTKKTHIVNVIRQGRPSTVALLLDETRGRGVPGAKKIW